jgi:alanyl-tRNA synthetase
MTSSEIREAFCDFFIRNGHTLVPSSPLIPLKDPSLLFTNAGMVQFKDVFLGKETRAYQRAVSSQKCMRAGGKHNDLENVGWTGRHHTFFEMLGNFSFGDYFKAEATSLAWELLTKVWPLPKERLWITIYQDDDQAHDLWRKIGIPEGRIVRLGEKDNFWAMGDTGPCGPCSEIIYDQGQRAEPPNHTCLGVGCDCDRYLEIWNLVFMQYMRDARGDLTPLPKPSIDTGMGLERITAVLQGVLSNYETDLFKPLLAATAALTDRSPKEMTHSMAGRVIADHIRSITFLISDGVLPSNEGRGYVLRRVIRRAARYGKELGLNEPFLYKLTGEVVDHMKGAYPELVKTRTLVAQVTQVEEERFIETLDRGLERWTEVVQSSAARGIHEISGREAFQLYDTYGFPVDLASDIAREKGLTIKLEEFDAAMQEQKERARRAWVVKEPEPYILEAIKDIPQTSFVGYHQLEDEVCLVSIVSGGRKVREAGEGEWVELLFDKTPFYPEGGGQVGDQGLLEHPNALAEITGTLKPYPGYIFHQGRVAQGSIREGETYRAVVNPKARWGSSRNHTGTHVLHAVLREVIGEHVKQSGSLVAPDRLRFDFTHFKALTSTELKCIEEEVNERLRGDYRVKTQEMPFQEAIRAGALAFFDDKYGDRVRVVTIEDFSKELCGGTHCHATGEVGFFKLVQESSIASGIRRIEALTGEWAYHFIKKQEEDIQEVATLLKVQPTEVVIKARKVLEALRQQERDLERLKGKQAAAHGESIAEEVRLIGSVRVLSKRVDGLDPKELRAVADSVRDRIKSGVVVMGSGKEGRVSLVAMVTRDLTGSFHAGNLLKEIAGLVGGSGGGRPEMAQAGGKDAARLDEALEKVYEIVEKIVGGGNV